MLITSETDSATRPRRARYRAPDSVTKMRPPTPSEIAEAGRTAGLSGSGAGRLLGVSSRQWRRWLSGECEMPAATYQWLLVATGLHPDYGPRRARL